MTPFPHKVYAAQTTCGVTVDHTLAVLTVSGELLQEIDCCLHIEVGSDQGDLIWEVGSVSFRPYGTTATVYFDGKNDPTIWELVRRSVMANFKSIDEEVAELAREAA